VVAGAKKLHGRPHSVNLTLPPLGIICLRFEGNGP
jgi:hypothetical protein